MTAPPVRALALALTLAFAALACWAPASPAAATLAAPLAAFQRAAEEGRLPAAALPRVHVLTTGGTIASATAGMLDPDDLTGAVPGLGDVARITTERFSAVGSSQIGPEHWIGLSRRISELFASDPELAGVVVTHGTDTMEETALFLDLTVAGERPVVLTGSMRPPSAVGAEGAGNLLDAVRVAVSPEARGRGALVVMNDEVFSARDVAKTHTTRLDAFAAPRGGPVAAADPDRVVFHRPAPASRPRFALPEGDDLPAVGIAYSYGGADGSALDAFVEEGAGGIVVATVGRGNLPAAQRRAAERAAKQGVAVVLSSRTGAGRVPVGSAVVEGERDTSPFVGAGDLNPQRARVVLALALAGGGGANAARAAFRLLEGSGR